MYVAERAPAPWQRRYEPAPDPVDCSASVIESLDAMGVKVVTVIGDDGWVFCDTQNVRTFKIKPKEGSMATDDKMYNDFGTDSSGSSSAQSPLALRGGSESVQSLGEVKTDFDPMSLSGEARSDD